MNKIILIGNLTKDPEQRETSSGVKVTSFTIAVNRRFASDGEKVTDFFRINAWRGLADSCFNYLSKGRKVGVIGELQARTYENHEGKSVMSLDVSADEVEFLTPRSEDTSDQFAAQKPKKERKYTEADFTDCVSEDVPF